MKQFGKGEGVTAAYNISRLLWLSVKSMGKKRSRQTETLREELKYYEKQGISLWLNGRASTPREIEKAHRIAEDGVYMRDYVQNEKGEIEKLKFDFVKDK